MIRKGNPRDFKLAVLDAWATNNHINQFLVERLPEKLWRAEPPGGRGRTVAQIFAHVHNCRLMWIKMTVRPKKRPAQLDRRTCTRAQVVRALAQSGAAFAKVIEDGLKRDDLKVPNFPPDAVAFFAYIAIHEGHHRGQVLQLARQLGIRMPADAVYGVWHWNKRRKEAGFRG